uniref:Endonuclease/exonuclease/phosphatase domain-containing protein n=1 Tax=Tetranychus urticae TaxID=32264 RepID=T1L0A3_TETUR
MYRLGLSPQHFATGLVSIQAIWHPAGFAVINTHCPSSQAPRELFSYWITMRATITWLLSGGRDFFGNLIEPCSSMLVCGDFNTDIDRPNLRNLRKRLNVGFLGWFETVFDLIAIETTETYHELPGMAGRQREHLGLFYELEYFDQIEITNLCGWKIDIFDIWVEMAGSI